MNSIMKTLHPVAGGVAMLLVSLFFVATVCVEMLGDPVMIAGVKRWILYGVALLIPAAMAAGVSGFRLAGGVPGKGPLAVKARRMKVIAGNGLLVLLPAAVLLERLAAAGDFGVLFMTVQGLELVAGPVNFVLLALNMRDGLAISRKRRMKEVPA